jgi:predicted transcriptional regulator
VHQLPTFFIGTFATKDANQTAHSNAAPSPVSGCGILSQFSSEMTRMIPLKPSASSASPRRIRFFEIAMMIFTDPLKIFRIEEGRSKRASVLHIDNRYGLTYLDLSRRRIVPAVKISSKVEESVWRELRAIAEESHQSIGGLLTEAIRDYVRRRRVRPEVMKQLDASIAENEELGRLLAQ